LPQRDNWRISSLHAGPAKTSCPARARLFVAAHSDFGQRSPLVDPGQLARCLPDAAHHTVAAFRFSVCSTCLESSGLPCGNQGDKGDIAHRSSSVNCLSKPALGLLNSPRKWNRRDCRDRSLMKQRCSTRSDSRIGRINTLVPSSSLDPSPRNARLPPRPAAIPARTSSGSQPSRFRTAPSMQVSRCKA
jgi:hypothetical protein